MSNLYYNCIRTSMTRVGTLTKGLLLATAAVLFSFAQIQAQEAVNKSQDKNSAINVYSSNMDAAAWEDPNATKNMSFAKSDIIDAVENPDLNDNVNCSQLRVTLLLDESGSILNRDGIEQVEDATLALAQVLEGTPALLSIVEFENQARTIFPPQPVDAQYLIDLEAYLTGPSGLEVDGLGTETYNPTLDFLNQACPFGNTNWEAGLLEARSNTPNLLIFLTDGEPVSRNDDTNPCGFVVNGGTVPNLNAAIEVANDLRLEDGVHMFGYGVGNGINGGDRLQNLLATTGPDEYLPGSGDIFTDDYSTGEFEDLAAGLSAGLNELCGVELDIEKMAVPDQVCGDETVTYTITISNFGNDDLEDLPESANNVIVEDVLPAGFELDAIPAGAVLNGNTLTWDLGTIEDEAEVVLSYSGNFPGANGEYVNTASVDATNALEESDSETVTKGSTIDLEFDEEGCLSFDLSADAYGFTPDPDQDQTIDAVGLTSVLITGTNAAGCPVEATINVTILDAAEPAAPDNVEICDGGEYFWPVNGETYTAAGTYFFPENASECEVVNTLNLSLIEATLVDVGEVEICPGDDYFDEDNGVEIDNVELGINQVPIFLPGDECPSFIYQVTFVAGDDCGVEDCFGTLNGTASIDDCGVCSGGETGIEVNACFDCNNVPNGTASIDDCGVCSGGDTGVEVNACFDCNNVPNGNASIDECGVCSGGDTGIEVNACFDCNNVPNGTASIDECGVCSGGDTGIEPNSTCLDCEGVVNGDTGAGDPCQTDDGANGTYDANCDCIPNNEPEFGDCPDFRTYLIHVPSPGADATLYSVDLNDPENAIPLAVVDESHLGVGPDGLLYITNGHTLTIMDPEFPVLAQSFAINTGDQPIGSAPTAVVGDDGLVYIGYGSNVVYTVDPSQIEAGDTSVDAVFYDNASVNGGDLIFLPTGDAGEDELWVATRNNNRFTNVDDDTQAFFTVDATEMLGASVLPNGNILVANGDQGTTLDVYEPITGDFVTSFNVGLPLFWGDLASRCFDGQGGEDGCQDFQIFLTAGGNQGGDIYRATLDAGSSSVALDMLIENVGDNHIAFNPADNVLYIVRGSGTIGTYDLGTNDGNSPASFFNIAEGTTNINQTFAVLYVKQGPNAGDLLVGSANKNEVYVVDPLTGQAEYFASVPVDGGDLIQTNDGDIWLINRGQNRFYNITGGGSPSAQFNVNELDQIYGATVLDDGLILVGDAGTQLRIVDPSTGDVDAQVYNLPDGLSLSAGDLAGGCADAGELDICLTGENGLCYPIAADYTQGTMQNGDPLPANRSDISNALGAPERTDGLVFTTLGYGGSIVFDFGGLIPNVYGDDIEVVETTFNNPVGCSTFPEFAIVSVALEEGGPWYSLGQVCKSNAFVDMDNAVDMEGNPVSISCARYVKVSQDDQDTETMDGFDVDGVVALGNCDLPTPQAESFDASPQVWSAPNPSNGISVVNFEVKETSRTTVEVFDMNGNSVIQLFNEVANANQEYRMDFNGSHLANGIYIARLVTNNEVVIHKIMIAR